MCSDYGSLNSRTGMQWEYLKLSSVHCRFDLLLDPFLVYMSFSAL